jgi:integrase
MLQQRRAEVPGLAKFTMHDARRTVATGGVRRGALRETQYLLGHARPEQTLAYTRYLTDELDAFVDSMPNPFEG